MMKRRISGAYCIIGFHNVRVHAYLSRINAGNFTMIFGIKFYKTSASSIHSCMKAQSCASRAIFSPDE